MTENVLLSTAVFFVFLSLADIVRHHKGMHMPCLKSQWDFLQTSKGKQIIMSMVPSIDFLSKRLFIYSLSAVWMCGECRTNLQTLKSTKSV